MKSLIWEVTPLHVLCCLLAQGLLLGGQVWKDGRCMASEPRQLSVCLSVCPALRPMDLVMLLFDGWLWGRSHTRPCIKHDDDINNSSSAVIWPSLVWPNDGPSLTFIMLAYHMLKYPLKCALDLPAVTHFSGYLNNQWWYSHALTSYIHCSHWMNLSEASEYTYNEESWYVSFEDYSRLQHAEDWTR